MEFSLEIKILVIDLLNINIVCPLVQLIDVLAPLLSINSSIGCIFKLVLFLLY